MVAAAEAVQQFGALAIGEAAERLRVSAVDAQPVGEIELKGFGRPLAAYEVRALN